MSKSDALEADVLNTTYRGQLTFAGATVSAQPANRFMALFSADPTDAGTGAEITLGGITRVAVANAATSWGAPAANGAAMRISNSATITFPETTGNAGTATHWGFLTAATGGTLLHHGAMATSRALTSAGITLSFPAGSVTIDEG